MSVLPIVDRELRVTSRRSGTYWMRFGAALGMLGVWLILLMSPHFTAQAQMGHNLLNALGVLALLFSMLAGIFLTSDCLSEEKREGTLGLLFLTDLKSYDIILGKLTAHSLHAFFGLLSVVPILGLALLVGGVTGPEFGRLTLVFVTTLFFSLGISMAVSAASSEAKQAIAGAFLLMVVFAGVFPALWWFQWMSVRSRSLDFLLLPSPVFAYCKAFDLAYRAGSGAKEFWSSLATLFALGFGGIVVANVLLPRSWQERRRTNQSTMPLPSMRGFSPKAAFKGWPVFSLDEPMYWLAARDSSARLMTRKVLLCMTPFWLVALAFSLFTSHYREAFMTALFVAYAMHFVVKVLITTEASRRMNLDRRNGAWELLLVTPLPVKAVLRGQKKALQRHFRGAMIALSLVNAALMLVALVFHERLSMDAEDRALFGEMFLGGVIALYVDFYGLGWVGMWRGLTARQHHRAVLGTLLEIMSAPLILFFLLFFLEFDPGGAVGVAIMMGVLFALGIIVAIARGFRARKCLEREFRAAVLQHG